MDSQAEKVDEDSRVASRSESYEYLDDDEELAQAIALSLRTVTPEETEPLPDDWNHDYFLDFAYDVRDRFRTIPKQSTPDDELIFGSDELLLDFKICASAIDQAKSPISWSSYKSRLWFDRPHRQRSFQRHCHCHPSKTPVRHHIMMEDGKELDGIILPWEKSGPLVEYIAPSVGDRWSPALGVHLPRIDLDSYEFRLLLLFPSFGQGAMPLRASVFVSELYLHSCYIAIRHSRGNPGVRGSMQIDGHEVDITKTLETFLRHLRQRDHCIVLYVRELCVNRFDKDEVAAHLNGAFHSVVENSSCGILDMSRVMEDLEDNDLLALEGSREKSWNELVHSKEEPWHRPRILSYLRWPENDLTDDKIAQLPPYHYVPLDLVVQEIRLITLYPAKDRSDPIVVDIAHAPLYGDLNYAALSYVWGSNRLTSTIRAAGNRMMVTQNLEKALRQVRETHRPHRVTLWVDAICINQQSETEKNRHIPRMQKIYEAASGVLVWIAPNDEISNTVVDFLKEIDSPKLTLFEDIDDGSSRLTESPRLSEAWAELYRFFNLPFFTRKWIIQEISSASVPTVLLDDKRFSAWRDIQTASFVMSRFIEPIVKMWLRYDDPIIKEFPEFRLITCCQGHHDAGVSIAERLLRQVHILTYVRQLRVLGRSPSFLLLALLTQYADCADARDKLYSIWSISQESESLVWKPSYSTSVENNYIQFTKAYTSHHKRLDIMCASQFPATANIVQNVPYQPDLDLPSWCPDWRQSELVSSLLRQLIIYSDWDEKDIVLDIDQTRYHADCLERHGRDAVFSFVDRSLICHGVIIDSIKFVSSGQSQHIPLRHVPPNWLQDAINHVRKPDGTELSSEELASQFYCTMIGEPLGTVHAVWKEVDGGLKVKLDNDRGTLASIASYGTRLANMITGRRFVVTKGGKMGLAPWHVKEDFKVAVVLGCSVPILLEYIDGDQAQVLRNTGFLDDRNSLNRAAFENTAAGWYFRGDCFVQGFMEGQVISDYGTTTEEAWQALSTDEHKLQIH